MRFAFALSIMGVLAGSAVAKDWDEEAGLYAVPWADKTAKAFFAANPAAEKPFVAASLDKLFIPGGETCKLPDYPDTKGTSSIYVSPDKKTLVILGSANLSRRNAKALKLAAEPDTKAYVLVVIDGPSGAMWTKRLDGDGCMFISATAMWNADSTKLLAITEHGQNVTEDVHALVIDIAKKKVRADLAASIEVDGGNLFDVRYSDGVFASANRITFCAKLDGKPLAKYEVGESGVTKVGACAAPKPAAAK